MAVMAMLSVWLMWYAADPLPGRLYGLMDPAYGKTDHPLVVCASVCVSARVYV